MTPERLSAETLYITETGSASVTRLSKGWRLALSEPFAPSQYHNAQITSYIARADFALYPGLRLTVRAAADGLPCGTAGFGLWNHPFAPGERGLRLPKAAWFFFSAPPNDMRLARGMPGAGWKAATIDATRWQFLALTPTAPLGVLLMRLPALYNALWPVGQRALGVHEAALDTALLHDEHEYTLDWQREVVRFLVDGTLVLTAPLRLRGPLGFIAWTDTQYAVITPQGRAGFGLIDHPRPHGLMLTDFRVENC